MEQVTATSMKRGQALLCVGMGCMMEEQCKCTRSGWRHFKKCVVAGTVLSSVHTMRYWKLKSFSPRFSDPEFKPAEFHARDKLFGSRSKTGISATQEQWFATEYPRLMVTATCLLVCADPQRKNWDNLICRWSLRFPCGLMNRITTLVSLWKNNPIASNYFRNLNDSKMPARTRK